MRNFSIFNFGPLSFRWKGQPVYEHARNTLVFRSIFRSVKLFIFAFGGVKLSLSNNKNDIMT
jgi:hypothetical protein